jgi:hypothetical protein
MKIDRIEIINAMLKKNYKVEVDDTTPYNFNIVGIRTKDQTPNVFNDWICLIWKYKNGWEMVKFECTTEPGVFYLNNPINVRGTFVLQEGQYLNSHRLGKHKGQYEALVQANTVTGFRDGNKNSTIELDPKTLTKGNFGINIHRASATRKSTQIDKFSAGCTVIADPNDFDLFMRLIKRSKQTTFTYTLLGEDDLM